MYLEQKVRHQHLKMKKIKEVGEIGTQNILDVINDKCKIIFPSTHVVYEGIDEVKTDIKEDESTKPVLILFYF